MQPISWQFMREPSLTFCRVTLSSPSRGDSRTGLVRNFDDEFLLSTTVQAIVYGMFAIWIESDSPENFRWQAVRDDLGVSVIAEIVYSALAPNVVNVPQVKGMLEGVAGVLRRVDRDALAAQFDSRAIE